ncbi:M protein, serotype 2.1-like [Palaemon carinicauda]|uniref:M protein, serotype 2.1-like n=1 Tax=Palaemon carinicauda TaxID=392227 RepID=UPI0035B5CAF6
MSHRRPTFTRDVERGDGTVSTKTASAHRISISLDSKHQASERDVESHHFRRNDKPQAAERDVESLHSRRDDKRQAAERDVERHHSRRDDKRQATEHEVTRRAPEHDVARLAKRDLEQKERDVVCQAYYDAKRQSDSVQHAHGRDAKRNIIERQVDKQTERLDRAYRAADACARERRLSELEAVTPAGIILEEDQDDHSSLDEPLDIASEEEGNKTPQHSVDLKKIIVF